MIKKILLPLILILSMKVDAQYYSRMHVDSLESCAIQQVGVDRINTVLELANLYTQIQLDSAIMYAEFAKAESIKLDYQWGVCKSFYCKAAAEFSTEPVEDMYIVFQKCAEWFEMNGFEKDALKAEILVSECIAATKGSVYGRACYQSLLNRAYALNDLGIIAKISFQLNKYGPNLLDGTNEVGMLDTATKYFNQIDDSLWILSLNQYNMFSKVGREEMFALSRESYEVGKRWGNRRAMYSALWSTLYGHLVLSQLDSVDYYHGKLNELCEIHKNPKQKSNVLETVAFAYFWVDSLEYALSLSEELLAIDRERGNLIRVCKSLRTIGSIQLKLGNYEASINAIVEAIRMAEKMGDEYTEYSAKGKLAGLYELTGEYGRAEEIYLDVVNWANEKLENRVKDRMLGNIHHELGELFQKQELWDKGVFHYQLSEDYLATIDLKSAIYPALGLLETYLEKDDMEKAKVKHDSILNQYALPILNRTPDYKRLKGELLIISKDYKEGINTLEAYLGNKTRLEFSEERQNAYYYLHNAYKEIGNFEKSLEAHTTYQAINDSLTISKSLENVERIEVNYEISLREGAIRDLEQREEISILRLEQQHSQLELRQLYIIVLIIMFLVLGLIGYLLFRRFRFKKEEEKFEMKARLELENIQAQQKVELAEAKNTLYANLSHEFRTPLTLIQVPIKNHLSRQSDQKSQLLNSVLKNTDHLLEMIDELLDLSKMQSGTKALKKSTFDLADFFAHLKADFSPLFLEKNIQIKWVNLVSDFSFKADENRLKIVLNNLLKNAYSHVPENGTVECTMQWSDKKLKKGLKLTVSNSGKGIAARDLPHIFKRYYRADEDSYSGTGIGLALCKQIVEMHAGAINVDTHAEGRVTFEIDIPGDCLIKDASSISQVVENSASYELSRLSNIEGVVLEPDKNLPVILVVEDKEGMRDLLRDSLKAEFVLHFAVDGQQGEDMAQELQPDIVLSDVMMPKKDGFELLNTLKQTFNTSHIPVVLLTARADSTSRVAGLDQDADDYIGKPFEPVELKARLHNLLRQRKQLHKIFSENPRVFNKEIKCTPIDLNFLMKARKILENNYEDGDYSVIEFCADLASNRNSVNTKLKALTNQSTAEYIRSFRLEKAIKLLVETELSMTEVYIRVGFNSPQSFNKVFKKKFACTPSEYRSGKQ